jgi:hypothetical protein
MIHLSANFLTIYAHNFFQFFTIMHSQSHTRLASLGVIPPYHLRSQFFLVLYNYAFSITHTPRFARRDTSLPFTLTNCFDFFQLCILNHTRLASLGVIPPYLLRSQTVSTFFNYSFSITHASLRSA